MHPEDENDLTRPAYRDWEEILDSHGPFDHGTYVATGEQQDALFAQIVSEVMQVNRQGRSEYARNENNVLSNFERIALLTDLRPEQVALVYLYKHMDGIISYINGHKSQREDVRGRIKDAITYLMIMRSIIEKREAGGYDHGIDLSNGFE